MEEHNEIQLFEGKQVRYVWDGEQEKYFFSVVDVIKVLTDSENPRRYWSDLKRKLEAEGSEVYEKIVQLKLPAPDGKMRLTDVADTEQVFRLIQSIPNKRALNFTQPPEELPFDTPDDKKLPDSPALAAGLLGL